MIKSSEIRVPQNKRIIRIVDKYFAPTLFTFCGDLKNDGCSSLVEQNLPFPQTLNPKRF